jgi:hypothetical protein
LPTNPAAAAPTKFDIAGIGCPEFERSTKVKPMAWMLLAKTLRLLEGT